MSSESPHDPFGQRRQDPALLLDALQKLALERLKPALDVALGRVDDYLFQRSESGHDDFGLNALLAAEEFDALVQGASHTVLTLFAVRCRPNVARSC